MSAIGHWRNETDWQSPRAGQAFRALCGQHTYWGPIGADAHWFARDRSGISCIHCRRLVETRDRPFPILAEMAHRGRGVTYCSWDDAERAYAVYSAKYGTEQSLERLAQRGGFGRSEMDDFAPGWVEASP